MSLKRTDVAVTAGLLQPARRFPSSTVGLAALCATYAMMLLMAAPPARADDGVVPARARVLATQSTAYARVEATAALSVRAHTTGEVSGFDVLPGDTVRAGAVLAHLVGLTIDAHLAQRLAAVRSARAAVSAARLARSVQRRRLSEHLSTRLTASQARAALSTAQARLDAARSALRAARAAATVTAPSGGYVLAIRVADGDRVQPGQVLLTLRGSGTLWLKASFYGSDTNLVRTGLPGMFLPADGAPPIPVKVRSVIGVMAPDGGEAVGLVATTRTPRWHDGEAGTVTLRGAKHPVVLVPTRALILDRGRWWLLLHGADGDHRRQVVPGPAVGDWTVIERGLAAGQPVVVTDAYLRFQRNVAADYQPQD